jgi:Kef-type K+ transport system membrane component KefB
LAEVTFLNVFAVSVVAFIGPLLLGLAPNLRIPAVVFEIVAGIVVGPSLLGWVHIDVPVKVLSVLGLSFLLFLAGLEIDLDRLRGRALPTAGAAFGLSVLLALGVGLGSYAAGLVANPLLVAVTLLATSLGLVIPVLKDSGRAETSFGLLVIAGASLADFGAVIMLSVFFSGESRSPVARFALLIAFLATVAVVGAVLARARRLALLSRLLVRLQDTTAQIRVRGAIVLLTGLAALAGGFGIEVLLASFLAGTIISAIDRDQEITHPQLVTKLEAVGYGFLVPAFFVASGIQFDLHSLLASPSGLARVPLFLVALLVVRGLPALLYRRQLPPREMAAAGLLQATSLPFIVAAASIGLSLGILKEATAGGLIAAGLVSVVAFPAAALALLGPPGAGSEARSR